nr:hypothetical protein BaRGS_034804 [Batillaria attramentaria]
MRAAFVDGVPVKDKIVRVKWIISSDWKALSLMKGVNSANANHFCLWCHCSKREITDFTSGDLKKTLKGLDIIKVLEPGPRHINNLNLLPRDLLKCALHSRTGREIPAATKKNTIVDRLQQLMTTEEQVNSMMPGMMMMMMMMAVKKKKKGMRRWMSLKAKSQQNLLKRSLTFHKKLSRTMSVGRGPDADE